jgi:hypothetical protein
MSKLYFSDIKQDNNWDNQIKDNATMNIPGIKTIKDNFGADYTLIDPDVMSKQKAWNWLLRNGWIKCPNKQYLTNGKHFAYNNKLHNFLVIQ